MPSVVLASKVTSPATASLSDTVKLSVPVSSSAIASPIESVGRESSFRIVPVALPSATVTFAETLARFTVMVSSGSTSPSDVMVTVTVVWSRPAVIVPAWPTSAE